VISDVDDCLLISLAVTCGEQHCTIGLMMHIGSGWQH